MGRSKELSGILHTKSPLTGGLIEQRQERNLLLVRCWWEGWRLARWRRRLLLERSARWLRREETVRVRESTSGPGNVRRGLADARTGLRVRWGVGLELVHEASLTGCRYVRWSADPLGKRGRKGGGRWLVLYSLLARLKQLINPVLNNVVAALNAQCSDVGQKKEAPFLLGDESVPRQNRVPGRLTSAFLSRATTPGAHLTLFLRL